MVKLNVYLSFAGNTEEVFDFYKSVFGGKFNSITRYKDMPMTGLKLSKADENKIMNISLSVGGNELMGTDVPNSTRRKVVKGNNVHIMIVPDSKAEADRIFKALSAEGKIDMPLSDEVWGDYYGSFKDKFGISWMINYAYKPGEKKS
jgi:PhnB protein